MRTGTTDIVATPRVALSTVGDMLHGRDPVGVLTAYVSARQAATPGDAGARALEVELERIVRSLEGTRGGDAAGAAAAVQAEVGAALDHAGDDSFVVFAGLGTGQRHRERLTALDASRVSLASRADVRSMCRALQTARPAGVVLLARSGVRVSEWAPRMLEELWVEVMPELEEPDLVGPSQGHLRDLPGSAPGFTVGQQRDLYERRMASEFERFVDAAASRISDLAAKRSWSDLVVSGEGELPGVLRAALRAPAPEVIVAPGLEGWRSLGQLSGQIGGIVGAHRERSEILLVRQLREEARLGTVGLAPVLEALGEGRVEVLLLPEAGTIRGWSSDDASMVAPAGSLPPGYDPERVTEDDTLADAMIARAVATGADVVVLSAAGTAALGEHGVAAVARW